MDTKRLLLTIAAVLAVTIADAIPARPGLFPYTQPDGSVIMLRRHGDEYFNWTTDASGQVVALGKDGFYRPSSISPMQREAARNARRNALALEKAARSGGDNQINFGERHIPVILMSFADNDFVIDSPREQFDKLLNRQGYSDYGATGSVRDYYADNSEGQFTPVFDIYGPVKLDKNVEDYKFDRYNGGDMGNAAIAISEAAVLLDSQIDFSKYDADGDGSVDMILAYYPGHNPAEGGPTINIWPHQWYVIGKRRTVLDGKLLNRYFCSSELKGSAGSVMCGIGTTCHEFAHTLGLPDFYDTDYEENGTSINIDAYSLMSGGSYLNDSRTPPYLSVEERIIIGWVNPGAQKILPAGTVETPAVYNNIAWKSLTNTENEYFVYEFRDGTGWDTYLPVGLVVYHLDKSTRIVGGYHRACDLWTYWTSTNMINVFGDHPCYVLVPAPDPQNLMYGLKYYEGYGYYFPSELRTSLPFPGQEQVTTFSPVDWEGLGTGVYISKISLADGKAVMKVSTEAEGTLAENGYNSIYHGKSYLHYDGEEFPLRILESEQDNKPVSVEWYFDGLPVSGQSVILHIGVHTVKALLVLADGREEVLEMEIRCE